MHREPSHRIAEPSGDQSRRAPLQIADGRHTALLSLQRTVGNRAVANLIRQWDGSNATADKVSLARIPKKPDAADVKSAQVRTKLAEPLARIKAKELINTARQVEPQVTEKLRLFAVRRGGRLTGLEHKIKGEGSLVRKIRDGAVERGLSPAEAVEREGAGINDALRYTIILPPGPEYGNLFAMISDLMKFWNITTNVRKDYWVKSETYHGVNMTFKTPETPNRPPFGFEVQLHTEDSFAMKQANHHDYEKARETKTSAADKEKLNAKMAASWGAVPYPEGFKPEATRARREQSGPVLTRPRH
jgi:hypothetical protein